MKLILLFALNQKAKQLINAESDENARAAVWFNGLEKLLKKFKLREFYDLSATPYYFNWFGLYCI